VHPYARDQRGELGAVTRARRIMRHYHDGRKQLWVTETGWATVGKVTHGTAKFKTSLRGQAKRLTKTYKLLLHFRRRYRIGMVVWFSFKDRAPYAGERNWWAINTGLFKRNGKAKPAWRAYK